MSWTGAAELSSWCQQPSAQCHGPSHRTPHQTPTVECQPHQCQHTANTHRQTLFYKPSERKHFNINNKVSETSIAEHIIIVNPVLFSSKRLKTFDSSECKPFNTSEKLLPCVELNQSEANSKRIKKILHCLQITEHQLFL